MSLLKRQGNDDKKNDNQQAAQQPATPPTPAPAPAPANSRFSRGNSNTNNNNANNKPSSRFGTPSTRRPAPPKSWRHEGTINRFGASDLAWVIAPIDTTFVRFDLRGLGDPFHRLLGEDINFNNFVLPKLLGSLEDGGEPVDKLKERLESTWENYKMYGATMMYGWNDDIKEIIASVPKIQKSQLIQPTNNDDDDFYFDDDEDEDNQVPIKSDETSGICLRAIDMLLVLNVLGRTKSNILLGNSQLILEEGFLNRSLVTNDPRLVAVAQATGCVEEHFSK